MRKAELILASISIFAVILNFIFVSYFNEMMVLAIFILSAFYLFFGFALFHNLGIREIFKVFDFKEIKPLRTLGSIVAGFVLSFMIFGILFKIQFWPGANETLSMGEYGLLIINLTAFFRYSVNKSDYYRAIFRRSVIFGGLGMFFLLIPGLFLIEIQYRNYPAVVTACKKVINTPYNDAVLDNLENEKRKVTLGEDKSKEKE